MTEDRTFAYSLCLSVDVQRYGKNDDVGQSVVQHDLLAVLDQAGERAGVDRNKWSRQGQGDEELSLIPSDIGATRVIDRFCLELANVLREHNARGDRPLLRLRLAIDAGPTALADNGYAGRPVVGVSRLVGSRPLRGALETDDRADLAVMLSNTVYQDWVDGGHCSVERRWFRPVLVSEKEYVGEGWIWLPTPDGTPDTEPDAGWEYLLLANTVRVRLDRLATKHLDHELRLSSNTRAYVADPDVADFLRHRLDEMASITARLTALFAPESLALAVGRPGEQGDAAGIARLGDRFATTYEELLDWAAGVRGTTVGPSNRLALDALARLADEPVRAVRRFVDDLQEAADEIARHYRSVGTGPLAVEVGLIIDFDRDLLALVLAGQTRTVSR